MPDVLLLVLIFLPAVITFLLKSNAANSFLALCGGFAVITLSGSDIEHLIGKTKITSLTSNDLDLILLGVPLLLTLIFTFKSVSDQKKRLLQLVPALCAGGLLAAVAGPMISDAINVNLSSSSLWKSIQNVQSYIAATGLIFSLFLIWSSSLKHAKNHDKKHK